MTKNQYLLVYLQSIFKLSVDMPKINIDFNKLLDGQITRDFTFDLDVLLFPTAIFIMPSKTVVINKYAHELLGLRENQSFNIDKWKTLNPQIGDILSKIEHNFISDQRILITLFNGKKEIVCFNLSIIKYNDTGRIYIIQFRKATNKYSVSTLSSLQTIGDDVKKLMPYLNNHGKTLLTEILSNHFEEDKRELISDDIVYYEKEIKIIEEAFPTLTHQEVIICGLLLNDLDSNEISQLTKRSLNSVFVTIHRINKKLNIKDRKDLIETLEQTIIKKSNEYQNNKIIDDFDI